MFGLADKDWLFAIILGLCLLLAAVAVWGIARTRLKGQVRDALKEWVLKAIFAGERAAVWGLQELGRKIDGWDKKAVADSVYNLLPNVLPVGRVLVPIGFVKQLVPRERFQDMVQDTYEEIHGFILRNEGYLASQVDALVSGLDDDDDEPEAPTSPPKLE
jgi:hypothetical protein